MSKEGRPLIYIFLRSQALTIFDGGETNESYMIKSLPFIVVFLPSRDNKTLVSIIRDILNKHEAKNVSKTSITNILLDLPRNISVI